MRTDRVEFLDLQFDCLTFSQVKDRLRATTSASPYAYVATPNVDHVVRTHRDPRLRRLYREASLCLCDSRVLRLLARIGGINLPLVAGSDLSASLFEHVIKPGDRLAVVGATAEFIDRLRARFPAVEVQHHVPPMGLLGDEKARRDAANFVASANARFSFITVGSPQQEMIANMVGRIPGASGTALCVGAALEFLTGDQRRAPRPLRQLGLEWAHRLATNPRRLGRRYLLEGPRIFPIYAAWLFRGERRQWAAGSIGIILAAALAVVVLYSRAATPNRLPAIRAALPAAGSTPLNLPAPDLLKPLSPEEAAKENAERPFAKRPDTPASKFILKASPDDRDRALNCLTQAVYYEAAGEGSDGERAVAQVVINRLHHPGFPASICGVVYQGSDRGTGCQFTFTCNGSLLRAPASDLWARARKIAQEAITGKVFAPVGHATHYHADYVLPYWADSLDKSVQIGRHIFYRLRSSLGDRNAFVQRYAGSEPVVHPPNTLTLPESAATEQLATALLSDSINGPSKDVEKAAQSASTPLAADVGTGSLIADGQGSAPVVAPARKPRNATDCSTGSDSKQLSPLNKADMRAGGSASNC